MDELILFSTGCPKCNILKKKLKEKNIQYKEENNIEKMLELGIESVPVLYISSQYLDFGQAVKWINNQ